MSIERTRGRIIAVPGLLMRIRLAVTNFRANATSLVASVQGPTVEERQRELIHFYQEYETLVETLCDSSQFGPKPILDKRYKIQREWMLEHYPEISKYVVAYLRYEMEDEVDPFTALFIAEDLETFRKLDDGNMISRIMRTREALNLYGDHLRQLASSA